MQINIGITVWSFIILMPSSHISGNEFKQKSVITCKCISFFLCDNGTEITDGRGLMEIRSTLEKDIERESQQQSLVKMCENEVEICCVPAGTKFLTETISSAETTTKGCGIRNINGIAILPVKNSTISTAKFGEFPWVVAILNKTNVYQCGGSLVHPKVVLTAAHCVQSKHASSMKVRVGEWNTQSLDENLPHQDREIDAILVHDNYDAESLRNDVALLILRETVTIAANVDIVCLARSNTEFDSSKCIANGWGKNKLGKTGQYQEILKKRHVSIVSRFMCKKILRNTRLSKSFNLDKSFVCAGGREGQDMCKGDGGSPLVCPLKGNLQRYVQVGLVSWGIGCSRGVPGIYANISHVRSWIDEKLLLHNLDISVYQY